MRINAWWRGTSLPKSTLTTDRPLIVRFPDLDSGIISQQSGLIIGGLTIAQARTVHQ